MRAKPTLGYASRTEAVLGFRASGLNTAQIAARIGVTESCVTALEHSAGRSSGRKKRSSEELCRTVLFPVDVLDALGPHAARRGIHPNQLARRIVEEVVDAALVDAVLDDREVTS